MESQGLHVKSDWKKLEEVTFFFFFSTYSEKTQM